MILQGNICYLRDPTLNDMNEFRNWYQPHQDWLQWDCPWRVFHPQEFEQMKANIEQQICQSKTGMIRQRLELCTNNHQHIGWVSSYFLNQNPQQIAIGITIVDTYHRGKGYGTQAYVLYIHYLLTCNYTNIFTQTWSGNHRMMQLANRLCFTEVERLTNYRNVNGCLYDQITYQLHVPCFLKQFCSDIDPVTIDQPY